jgi:phosphatidylinositol alpha-mannosyltransferase
LNIALICAFLPSGSKIGVGYQVHYLANQLVQRGHNVTVFSREKASPDSLYKVEVVPHGTRYRMIQFSWNLRHIDWTQFDVVNGHNEGWLLWGCKRPRHIHTYHGSMLAELLNQDNMRARIWFAGFAIVEYASLFLVDEKVTVSENTKKYLPWIKRVIPCGVDTKAFWPAEEKSEKPTLLFVGTMHGRKRGQMLLDLFKKLIKPAVPDAEFWAVTEEPIEGDGIKYFGRVPTEQLTDLFRKAWVFCLPSQYEGFGVPYIEAMASGTPVVAARNVGALEVIENGKWGMAVTDEELATSIIALLKDPSLREKYRALGLERSQHFSWDRVCAQYEAVYTEVGKERNRRSFLPGQQPVAQEPLPV